MKFLNNSAKTNWKFLAIAAVFALVSVGGVLLLKTTKQPASSPAPTVQKSISLMSPQGAEQREVGSRQSIRWNSVGIETVRISIAIGGKDLGTSQEIDASLDRHEDFVVPDMSGFGITPPYEVTILIFDAQDPNVSDRVTFTAIEPLDISTWQTYRNEEFGFEVKYPEEFQKGYSREDFVSLLSDIGSITFWSSNNTMGEYIKWFEDTSLSYREYSKQEGITVAGMPATQFEFSMIGRPFPNVVETKKVIQTYVHWSRDTMIRVQMASSPGYEPPKELYAKIISTLQFIEPGDGGELRHKANISAGDIQKLLDARKRHFIEIRILDKKQNLPQDATLQHSSLPDILLEDERIRSVLQEMEDNADIFLYVFSKMKVGEPPVLSLLLGPFDTKDLGEVSKHLHSLFPNVGAMIGLRKGEDFAEESNKKVGSNFDLAFLIDRGLPAGKLKGIYRPRDGFALFAFRPFAVVDYVVDGENQRLFAIDPGGFEHEKFPGALWIIDGKKKKITSITGVNGMVLLPDKTHLLMPKYFSVEKTEGVDEEKLREVANEVGVSPEVIRENIYGLGGKPVIGTFALFKLNLETLEQKSLGLMGGSGGIFMLDTGEIFTTNYGNVGFSEGPYFRFDTDSDQLIPMAENFSIDREKIIQPSTARAKDGEFTTFVDLEDIKLIGGGESLFYIEGRHILE